MRLDIKTILHCKQRYDTVGDYYTSRNGTEIVRVSKLRKEEYEWLIAIHEVVERFLCKFEGVTNSSIDKFDIAFEKNRIDDSEPGDHPRAPYRNQHSMATAVERMLCGYLNISWQEYEDACQNLVYKKAWEDKLPMVD